MGLAELLRKTVLGVALAFSSGSAGCTKQNFRESRVVAEQGLTNQQGEVSFGDQVVAKVQDETAQSPLENMVVHYLHTGSENTLLAIDPQGNYYPNFASFTSGETTERRRRKPRKIIIELDQFQEGMGAGQAIVDAFTYQGGDILGEDENYFKYCMSMEDILTTTIDLPAGIILIAPKLVYGEIAEFIASAGTALLKDVVNTFIVAEYGQQPGYEVHSPKQVMSICGEEYNDIICDISGDKLQQLLSPDLPYWHIVGACEQEKKLPGQLCASSELLCEEFNGAVLGNAWDEVDCRGPGSAQLNNGNLNMQFAADGIDCTLQSKNMYPATGTLVLETRWRVEEQQRTAFTVGLFNEQSAGAAGFMLNPLGEETESLYCLGKRSQGYSELLPCPAEVTSFVTTRIEMGQEETRFYLNDQLLATSRVPQMPSATVVLYCRNDDRDSNPGCFVDYVKLEEK